MSNPRIDGLGLSNGEQGKEYELDIYGGDFQEGATVALGAGIDVPGVRFRHDGHLIARIDIAAKAAVKKYGITVTNTDKGTVTKPNAFEVIAAK
jgi:hypothetical protein